MNCDCLLLLLDQCYCLGDLNCLRLHHYHFLLTSGYCSNVTKYSVNDANADLKKHQKKAST